MTNKNLFLIVTKYWYDRIASGEKRVEYRENSAYWKNRLPKCAYPLNQCYRNMPFESEETRRYQSCERCSMDSKFQTVEFQCGYSREYPRLKFSIQTIKKIKTPDEVKKTIKTEACFAIYFK